MALAAASQRLSEAEYLEIEGKADFKSEYFDGEMFAMAGGSPVHSLIQVNAGAEFRSKLKGKPCVPYSADLRIKVVATGLLTYPDLSIVCGELQFAGVPGDTVVNPIVIVEVLSDSTEAYDRGTKFEHYRQIATLNDYLLISQKEPRIAKFSRGPGESWVLIESVGLDKRLEIGSLGIVIELAEIFANVSFPRAFNPVTRRFLWRATLDKVFPEIRPSMQRQCRTLPEQAKSMAKQSALERLYDEHAQRLYAYLLNLTRGESDTRDILQEVFIKLARNPDVVANAKDERAFLIRLSHNCAVDFIRRRATRDKSHDALASEELMLFASADDPDARAFRRELATALGQLPGEQRQVVHLKLWEGLTFEQIAEALEISPNTAASRYRYGIDKLRELLRPLYEELKATQ